MFRSRERAIVLHAANELTHIFGDPGGILAERADVDDRIVRIIVDVRVGRENPLDAGSARFERRVFPGFVGKFRIAGGGNGHGGGERSAFVDAHASASFEIGADDQRNLCAALQFVGDYGGGIDLAALEAQRPAIGDDDEPADMIVLDLMQHFLVFGAFGGIEDAEERDHQHLPELLAQGHFLEGLLDPGIGSGRARFWPGLFL